MAAVEKYMPRCRIFLLDGEKFRTNLFALFFDLPLRRETATKTALLAEVLKRHDWQGASRRAEELFGALWDVSVVKKGDRQLLLFSLETLKAVDVEDALSFLRGRILRPLTEDGFEEEMVERQKMILKRKLEGRKDDRKAYALFRALEETAAGTNWAVSADGYIDELDGINGKNLFSWYRKVLETAEVKVFFCGEKTEKQKVMMLRKDFPGRVPLHETEEEDKERKEQPRFIQERMDLEQARLVLGFEAEAESSGQQAALLMMNRLLGGDPDSLLFQKVREEKGLCYDIRSFCYPISPYLFVHAGIKAEDAKETGKLVLKAIEQLKQEGVSTEKLRQAKDTVQRDYDGLADSPWAMVDFFAEQVLQGKELSTEKFLRRIERIDEEEICRAAAHLKLRAVYLLSTEEDDHGKA